MVCVPCCAKLLSVIELCLGYLKWALQTQRRSAVWTSDACNLKHHSFRTIFLQWTCKSYSAAGREPLHLSVCLLVCLSKRRQYHQKLTCIILHICFLPEWPYYLSCVIDSAETWNLTYKFFKILFGYRHGSAFKTTVIHAVYLSAFCLYRRRTLLCQWKTTIRGSSMNAVWMRWVLLLSPCPVSCKSHSESSYRSNIYIILYWKGSISVVLVSHVSAALH